MPAADVDEGSGNEGNLYFGISWMECVDRYKETQNIIDSYSRSYFIGYYLFCMETGICVEYDGSRIYRHFFLFFERGDERIAGNG